MENQINAGDQNTQQIGQYPINQPVQIPEKPSINYWMISTFVLVVVLTGLLFLFYTQSKTSQKIMTNQKQQIIPSPTDLFKYINKVENSKLQNAELEAWKVEINTNLLTDKSTKKFRINLPDGLNYEVERIEEQMQNSTCDSQQCTWIGSISGRSCVGKNTVTGKCSPGETITFILNDNAIVGTIPAVVGVNQYFYSVGGMTNDPGPFLIKIDPSKLGPD